MNNYQWEDPVYLATLPLLPHQARPLFRFSILVGEGLAPRALIRLDLSCYMEIAISGSTPTWNEDL